MATAIPNPRRLVVRLLQPRGATAMAPMALSTVIQARMGAVRSSVRMASVALTSSGDCKSVICASTSGIRAAMSTPCSTSRVLTRAMISLVEMVTVPLSSILTVPPVLPVARFDDSLVGHPVDLGPKILELRAGNESGNGGMDQRSGLLRDCGRQPRDHSGHPRCDLAEFGHRVTCDALDVDGFGDLCGDLVGDLRLNRRV